MKCSYKFCYYHDPSKVEGDMGILRFRPCDYCSTVNYHSDSCKRDDWDKFHKAACPGMGGKSAPVSQTKPTLNQALPPPQTPSEYNNTMKKGIEDFERVQAKDLGKGSYGSVSLVREKLTGQLFAMKTMSKKFIFQYSSPENLKREIQIQRKLDHPHIIKLFYYFEDKENVYLIMEYAKNGSLFHKLRAKRAFTEQEAFIYFFQTCLGINYLHDRQIIHRDLKPENLLIDQQDNVKVCDFGWSAELDTKCRTTFCGTIDYMAPEMLKKKPYDKSLDVWCLGILLYELLHGYPPFKGKNDTEKINNIKSSQPIIYNPALSKESVDLISKLIKIQPQERLTMKQIFIHPWVKKYELMYGINMAEYVSGLENKPLTLSNGPTQAPGIGVMGYRGENTSNGQNSNITKQLGTGFTGTTASHPKSLPNQATTADKATRFTTSNKPPEPIPAEKQSLWGNLANILGCG